MVCNWSSVEETRIFNRNFEIASNVHDNGDGAL